MTSYFRILTFNVERMYLMIEKKCMVVSLEEKNIEYRLFKGKWLDLVTI